MNRIKNLDGLRGLAIILVLIAHFPLIAGADIFNLALLGIKRAGAGYIGIEVFFILSGYLITKILIDSFEKNKRHFLSVFYLKRAFRILPVFYIAIISCSIIFNEYEFEYFYPSIFLSNYYFSFNGESHPLRHFWSLAVEEQYYLFWPLLLIYSKLSPKKIRNIFVIVICISVISIIVRDFIVPTEVSRALIYRSVESRMLALSLGGMFAFYGVPKPSLRSLLLILAGVLITIATFLVLNKLSLWEPIATIKAFGYLLVSSIIFTIAFHGYHIFDKFFSFAPLVFMGKISYGVYVYHLPVYFYFGVSHMQLDKDGRTDIYTAIVIISVTLAISLASWYLVEKPLSNYKDTLLKRSSTGLLSRLSSK